MPTATVAGLPLASHVISSPSVPLAKSATSTLDRLLPVPLASNVLLVNVSVVALPTKVSVAAGSVNVVVPAIAVALTVVVPLVEPACIKVPLLNVLAPVLVCADAKIISPEPAGVAHVPSPRQYVDELALVPLLRLVTGRLPVTSADKSTLLILLPVPLASKVLLVKVLVLDAVM